MELESLISMAHANGASDLHLEPGLPAAIRVRGAIRTVGDPIAGKDLLAVAQRVISEDHWPGFLSRRSFDFSRTVQGVRCRFNVFNTARGVAFSIRLLASFQATIDKLNLHPDLRKLIARPHGLILVSGPTGSGKSSTLAALIQEINLNEARHIITLENPIEYTFRPRRAFIRQREVGRDTPSFDQGLLDSLREDPDVLMVGEMREPETMRLTLNASETGHLVLATLHSSTCAEALQRVVSAFAPEIQSGVAAQLADCLLAVICQRLHYRADLAIRVPECEILLPTHAVKNFIRNRDFFKIVSSLETGADHGMWTFQRYRSWLDSRTAWSFPDASEEPPDSEGSVTTNVIAGSSPSAINQTSGGIPAVAKEGRDTPPTPNRQRRIDIEPIEGEFGRILKRPDE